MRVEGGNDSPIRNHFRPRFHSKWLAPSCVLILLMSMGCSRCAAPVDGGADGNATTVDSGSLLPQARVDEQEDTFPVADGPPRSAEEVSRGVVVVSRAGINPATASGFIISNNGLVVTTREAVGASSEFELENRYLVGVAREAKGLDWYQARPVWVAPANGPDLAVLKLRRRPTTSAFNPLVLLPLRPGLGDDVAVVGFPQTIDGEPTVSLNRGIISASRAVIDGRRYLRTDAAINEGNQGGPLVDAQGYVVGVITTKTRGDNTSTGYAVPLEELASRLEEVKKRSTSVDAPEGPLSSDRIAVPSAIQPLTEEWEKTTGNLEQADRAIVADNDGSPFWLTSRRPLPPNFQLSMNLRVDALQGRQAPSAFPSPFRRGLIIRWCTDQTSRDVMEGGGYTLRYSDSILSIEKKQPRPDGGDDQTILVPARAGLGSPTGPMRLVLTQNNGRVTLVVNGTPVASAADASPLACGHRFSVGGYLSRLTMGEVTVLDLHTR